MAENEIEVIRYKCERGYFWTEEVYLADLDSTLEEARVKREGERAKALLHASAKHAQLAFSKKLDASAINK